MAVTIAIVKRLNAGNRRQVLADVTGPASYTTGGETLTVAQQNQLFPELGQAATVSFATPTTFFQSERNSTGQQLVLDRTNNKMMFFAAGAEVASTTNLSAVTVRCKIDYGFGAIS